MRGRPAFIADCGICSLIWDADTGMYDLIESDICPDHGVGGWGVEDAEEAAEEDAIGETQEGLLDLPALEDDRWSAGQVLSREPES